MAYRENLKLVTGMLVRTAGVVLVVHGILDTIVGLAILQGILQIIAGIIIFYIGATKIGYAGDVVAAAATATVKEG